MVRIQLATGYLDVKEGTAFPLNFQLGDIRDISQRKGNFSKTIKLIGSKNNNRLLGQYYDVNIQAGTFNINALTTCSVIQDGIPIMENVSMQLINVVKVQDTSGYEESVEYEVFVKDSKADFFTAINNLELTDIDMSDFNHTYDAFNVVNRFTNTVVDGFKYFLPYDTDSIYNTNEFKPAFFAKVYLDRIFANAGFQYNWPGLTAARFDKLIIPYNGDTDNFDYNDYRVKAEITTPFTLVGGGFAGFTQLTPNNITGWTETEDPQNLYNPLTGVYSTPFNISTNNGQDYTYAIQIRYRLELNNTSGVTLYAGKPNNGPFVANPIHYQPQAKTTNNLVLVSTANLYTNQNPLGPSVANAVECPLTIPPGVTTILTDNVYTTLSLSAPFLPQLSPGRLQLGVDNPNYVPPGQQNAATAWRQGSVSGAPGTVIVSMVVDSIYLTINLSNNIIATGGVLEVNDYIPKKIKQSDFVKAIFNMFNLYAEVDKVQPNLLNLIHRDDYYDAGAEVDWTYKLAKDEDQELSFLPELSKKKVILTYAPDKDSANTTYTNSTNQIYGQAEVTFDNEYVKDVDTKALLFSPTPITTTPFGAHVPMINGFAPANNIRILYDSGVMKSVNSYAIYDYWQVGQTNIVTYPYVGHFDDPLLPTFDINFAICAFYYYNVSSLTENNLYNRYWRRTMGQINNGKMLTAMFNLTESDIQKMKLNDKIRIDNSWWNINKVIDYDANANKLTKVELISVDNEINFMPFGTNGGGDVGVPVGNPNQGPVALVANLTILDALNNLGNVSTTSPVRGRGNIVPPGLKTLVVGDRHIVDRNGIVTDNLTVRTSLNGVPVDKTPYRYVAKLNQVGVADPTAYVLEGSLGNIVWTRVAQGWYYGYLEEHDVLDIQPNDIAITISSTIFDGLVVAQYRVLLNVIEIYTTQIGVGLVDNYLIDTTIMINYYKP